MVEKHTSYLKEGIKMKYTILLSISIALLLGLLMSRLAKKVGLPAVTAYLVTGVLIGPFCLGSLNFDGIGFASEAQIGTLSILSDVALGFIAFAIGNEFRLSQLKAIGKQAGVIGQIVVNRILAIGAKVTDILAIFGVDDNHTVVAIAISDIEQIGFRIDGHIRRPH